MIILRRLYPPAAFFGGFVADAFSIGQRVQVADFWRLGSFLFGAAVIALWLALRGARKAAAPVAANDMRGCVARLAWLAPYLLMQFFFGSIFSALFILYLKSSGHLGSWMMAAVLGALLVANEFAGDRYGRRFTLTWSLLALNAILLFNFVVPHLVGSLNPLWFYVSTGAGILLTHLVWRLSPGQPGRILPAWGIAGALLLVWYLGMVAPVPLVKRDMAVGHSFVQVNGRFSLRIESPPRWQFWRDQAATVHVPEGGRLYGVSAVFAPLGVTAALEHRWEVREKGNWRQVYIDRFQSTGGRERGFRGYSWVLNPQPGEWRFTVGTQDGRTIGVLRVRVERGSPGIDEIEVREF